MKNITFIGQINSTNIEFGRGKDKTKRKRKALLTTAGTIGSASAVGGALGTRSYQRKYARFIYEGMLNGRKPTNTNVSAIAKNLQRYKLGQGPIKADLIKRQFNQLSREGGLKGAALLGATAAGALGLKATYNKLKNRKTIKIAGKTLSYQKPGT